MTLSDTNSSANSSEDAFFIKHVAAMSHSHDLTHTITEFLRDARTSGLSVNDAIDMFCVSTPNIIEESQLDDAAKEQAVAILDKLLSTLRWL